VVKAGESIEDKNANLIKGVQRHYADVCQAAREEQKKYGDIPIIGMGHLFTAGGKTIDGDGVNFMSALWPMSAKIFSLPVSIIWHWDICTFRN